MRDWGWDERELVRRCKEGSEAGYAELVRQHGPRLYTLAYRLTNDREMAEDVVQDAFLAAFRAIERFEPRPSLAAWLNTITLRVAGKAAARRRERPASLSPVDLGDDSIGLIAELVDPAHDPQAAAEAAEVRAAISDAIVALPFNMRSAVVLRHILGLEYAEAARAMDVPLNTYKSHLLRGTRLLRESLAGILEPPKPVERVVETPAWVIGPHGHAHSGNGHDRLERGLEMPVIRTEEAARH